MTDKPKYYDVRADFWREHFERAAPLPTYLQRAEADKAAKWRAMAEKIPALSATQKQRLTGYNRRLNVLVYSGVWCGDCVRQGPLLDEIAAGCGEKVELRFIERDDSPKLRDELRILGALRVPVAVFLSEDFHEVGRFGDRLLTAYRAKAAREIGPACDAGITAPPPEQLAAELNEWVEVFERMLLMLRLAPPLRKRYGD